VSGVQVRKMTMPVNMTTIMLMIVMNVVNTVAAQALVYFNCRQPEESVWARVAGPAALRHVPRHLQKNS
jgi:hypothetical protein